MKVIHFLDKRIIEKEVKDNLSFLLTNHLGGYLFLGSRPASRYQGWFFAPQNLAGKKIFKLTENIEPISKAKVSELKNNFWNVERKRGNIIESFFLPPGCNSLIYQLNELLNIELVLDLKESYDNREFGRFYEIFEHEELIVIKCQNNEDSFYLAIKPDIPGRFVLRFSGSAGLWQAESKSDRLDFSKPGEWTLRDYQLDRERNSPPFERYVYRALRMKAQKIVFSVAEEKTQAIKEAREVFKNTEELKKLERERVKKLLESAKKIISKKNISEEIKMAYFCAQNSLNSLAVYQGKRTGLYAGLPWFFQFWTRDEAISLKAFMSIEERKAKDIFWRQLEAINREGNTPNSADAVGWVFKRAEDFIKEGRFNSQEIKRIKQYLEKIIGSLLKYQTRDSFVLNVPGETWMDSLERAVAPIEIQALRLNLYKLASQLRGFWQNKGFYLKLEKELRKKVREKFWNNQILADGFDPDKGVSDFTIRPNIFLAAYIYPGLLKRNEWIKCFENILPKLWLDWGGIATIDKEHPSFHPQYTGEPPESYHQGDSWFYLNNLAALVLARTDKRKFQWYINKILEASAKEILWQGIIGHHTELSSARSFGSQGCLSQSWSNALYIELVSALNQ